MDCNRADTFIMMYMDNTLSESDAGILREHFEICRACKADFIMYDQIMTEFSAMPILNAPENFEQAVMAEIEKLPVVYARIKASADNTVCLVCGAFSVMSGFAFLAYLNREAIVDYVSSIPGLESYGQLLVPVSNYVSNFIVSFSNVTQSFAETASVYLAASRGVLLAVFVALAIAQYLVYKKDKIKVGA